VRKFCSLKPEALAILKAAMEDPGLPARTHDQVLKVARTIVDLGGHDDIQPQYITEA
jgi:magnesium chelatase family protein